MRGSRVPLSPLQTLCNARVSCVAPAVGWVGPLGQTTPPPKEGGRTSLGPAPLPKMGFGWCITGSNEAVNGILGRRSLIAGLDSLDSRLSLACRHRLSSSALPNCREGLFT